MVPSINSANCFEIARPSPVPPYVRVVDESTYYHYARIQRRWAARHTSFLVDESTYFVITGKFSPPMNVVHLFPSRANSVLLFPSNFVRLCPSANSVHLFPSRANSAIFRVLVFRRLVPGSGVMGVGFRVLGFVLNLRTTTSQKCAAVPRRARI